MLPAVFTFLRGIGILLLIAAALLAAVILLILFVPVRYEFCGRIDDPEGRDAPDTDALLHGASFSFHFSWLLHLVRGGISWPQEHAFLVKIGFITLDLSKFPVKSRKEDEKDSGGKSPKRAHRGSIKETLRRVRTYAEKAQEYTKSEGGLRRVLTEGTAQVIKPILPVEWSLTGTVGLGDPAAAGTLLEIEGFLLTFMAGHLWILPEFMNYRCDLEAKAKGRIQIFRILIAVLRLMKKLGVFDKAGQEQRNNCTELYSAN